MKIKIVEDKYDGLNVQITHNGYQWQNINVRDTAGLQKVIDTATVYIANNPVVEGEKSVHARIDIFMAAAQVDSVIKQFESVPKLIEWLAMRNSEGNLKYELIQYATGPEDLEHYKAVVEEEMLDIPAFLRRQSS